MVGTTVTQHQWPCYSNSFVPLSTVRWYADNRIGHGIDGELAARPAHRSRPRHGGPLLTTAPPEARPSIAYDLSDVEPRIAEILDLKLARQQDGPYLPLNADGVVARLTALATASGVPDPRFSSVRRMAGGASKEQFSCILDADGQGSERLVLRMDPLEGVVETCRFREAEVFAALAGLVPTPTTRFLDGHGTHLGRPGIVTGFVDGVTKPPDTATVVSGVGTSFTSEWREKINSQYIGNLAHLHSFDWRSADLPHFQAPDAHPARAALWQINWWARAWRDDVLDPYAIITLAEHWMRERLPETDDLVLLHGDYRAGNFMFDGETGEFGAVLDWELAHIGDFHEDLGWVTMRLLMSIDADGNELVCGLMTREELIERYEAATGRTVNRRTLAFYEALANYKCAVMNLASGPSAAVRGHNHQDVLLSWIGPVGHTNIADMTRIIAEEA